MIVSRLLAGIGRRSEDSEVSDKSRLRRAKQELPLNRVEERGRLEELQIQGIIYAYCCKMNSAQSIL